MKKTYTFFIALAVSTASVAQKDTTGFGFNIKDILPIYKGSESPLIASQGGYVFGNNGQASNFLAVAQGYQSSSGVPIKLEGVMYSFARLEHDDKNASTSSKVVVKIHNMDFNSAYNKNMSDPTKLNTTVKNWVGPASGAALDSVDLLFSSIDTSFSQGAPRLQYIAFPNKPVLNGDFAIGMDFRTLAPGDTLGLWNDGKGSANQFDLAFVLSVRSVDRWMVADMFWSGNANGYDGAIDCNLALFAVFSAATGVNEYYNGMKLTAYPVPANDHTTIEYTLEKNASAVHLKVYDAVGKQVLSKEFNSQVAGTYKVNFETNTLSEGNYFYQLTSNGNMFTKKLVVVH
jgi:hypothetical protein